MKSIIQDEKQCYFCGRTVGLEDHHIFFNALRPIAERFGLKVWLCWYHHRDTKHGVHGNREMDLILKRKAQEVFEQKYSHDKYMATIGRNYLESEE